MSTADYDVRQVIESYVEALGQPNGTFVRDASELAYSKEVIKYALQFCIRSATADEARAALRSAYISLGNFQQLTAEEKGAVALLSEVGEPAAEGSELQQEQARRLGPVAVPLQAVMDRLKADLAILTQELKELPGGG